MTESQTPKKGDVVLYTNAKTKEQAVGRVTSASGCCHLEGCGGRKVRIRWLDTGRLTSICHKELETAPQVVWGLNRK